MLNFKNGLSAPFTTAQHIFSVKHSVLYTIWAQVLIGTIFSIIVVVIHEYVYKFPDIQFYFVLGTVIGLLLVFRTTTGYERFWEGRKLWSDLVWKIKVATRVIWLGVAETDSPQHRIEKRTAINLLIAFAYATKNYLRDQYSYDNDPDISQLTRHLPRIQIRPIPIKDAPSRRQSKTISKPKSDVPKPEASIMMDRTFSITANVSKPFDSFAPTNIPMELIYYYQTIIYKMINEKRVQEGEIFTLVSAPNDLMNYLTQLERIRRTPIPMAYSVHLHQAIFLFLSSLPFQLVAKLGWATIAAQALICFAFLGILAIAWEIENPFGYDDNDLPLDDYCNVLRQEVERFVKEPFPDPNTWIISQENRPFTPECYKSAAELMASGQKPFVAKEEEDKLELVVEPKKAEVSLSL